LVFLQIFAGKYTLVVGKINKGTSCIRLATHNIFDFDKFKAFDKWNGNLI